MPAKNVRKIPTTYRAAQWTGTGESADDIRDILIGTNEHGYFNTESGYGFYAAIYFVGNGEKLLRVGDWVVSSSKGKVEVLTAQEYTRKYEDDD
jgi:hypothetical protein